MGKEHYGFCGFCGGELSSWTEELGKGFNLFMECKECHRVWQLVIDENGKMVAYGTEKKPNEEA